MKPQQRKDWLDSQYSPGNGDNAVIISRQIPSLFFFFKGLRFQDLSLAGAEFNERKTICRPSACDNTFAREKMHDRKTEEMPSMRLHETMERWPSRRDFWKTAALFLQGMWIALFQVVTNLGKFFFSSWEVQI